MQSDFRTRMPDGIHYGDLKKTLGSITDKQELYAAIVNQPFVYRVEMALLFLGIIVLLLVNEKTGTIDRIALADTELAKGTTEVSVKRFEDIKIPLKHSKNLIARAIATGQPQLTGDWQYLFTPALTPQEARFNQAGGGIGCSAIYSLPGARPKGALIFSYYEYPEKITQKHRDFMETYSQLVADQINRLG